MFVRPRILSILTTRRCTAACDHCCIGASPRATGAIPVPRIHGLIDEAAKIPTIDRIVFTGGECFLLGEDLDRLIRHAHLTGFETRVVTNGYWAVNERAAAQRASALFAAGLDEMMLSTGTFHQQFVPVERIIAAARAVA
ncbi:MAG: radical SAM protein, partial [Candidatus Eremiobacteraeota bacterium]|nr:radical SAM protein [Candidatus Eremiobacteraeota bacterium]